MLLLLPFQVDDNLRWKKKMIMERRGKRKRRKKLSTVGSKLNLAHDDRRKKRIVPDRRPRVMEDSWLLRVLLLLSSALLLLSPVLLAAHEEIGEGLTLGGSAPAASNQGAEALTVQQLERIKTESKVSASVGQNVILNCAVQFKDGIEKPFVVNWLKYPHKMPIYIWYAGYPPHVAAAYEKRVSRIGQASLNLTRVRESDQGLYECKIYYLDKRAEDKANGTWIFLDVQAPPRFLQTPAPISYVQAGDSLHLTCQAESTPAPTLRWYKNKTPIDSDSGAYRLSKLAPGSSSGQADSINYQPTDLASKNHLLGAPSSGQLDLFIDNVQAGSTVGEYRCQASNSEGSVEARSQVVLAVPAIITELPRNQTRVEGEQLDFTCQAKALPANITYKWLFNEKPLQQLKWFDNRYKIQRDGTLVIHSLHRDDQGHYKCQATNGLAHRQQQVKIISDSKSAASNKTTGGWSEAAPIYAEAGAYLTVEYPARVVYSPSIQYLPLGLSGVIRCHWEAFPPVLYYDWSLNGKQFDPDLDNNMERLKNGSLLVRQVSKQYEGKYMCTPFNKHGTLGSSAAMDVRVAEAPEFDLKPAEFYKANLNSHVKIPCSAKAHPRATVGWRRVVPAKAAESENEEAAKTREGVSTLRPGESAASEEEEEQQSVISYAKLPSDRSEYKNSHLLLHTLHKDDHGRYECFIENEAATLIASTMLYIEDTSPHAPTNVQVETKSWSARVSWQPGYDGGFEQSFVIWYRQVPRVQANGDESTPGDHPGEPSDLSWRSLNVQPSDATSFTVQNLTQDTSYEFYVRAKNIIGDGPRSQSVSATTKRALAGSLTPVRPDSPAPGLTPPSLAEGDPDPSSVRVGEEEYSSSTINPNVMGIIHLVYTTENPSLNSEQTSSTGDSDSQSSASQQQQTTIESVHQQIANPQSIEDQLKDSTGSTNSTKVYRVYFTPNKQNSTAQEAGGSSQHSAPAGNKRPRFDQPDQNKNNSNSTASTQPLEVLDYSTAPQNVSLMKVAQGWVVNWLPPLRPPTEGEHGETAAAVSQQVPTSASFPFSQLANDYWVEFREKGGAWQSASASRDTKLLLKDLKPGSEYFFRVYAIGPNGLRGAHSPEMKYLIPDNRRKPGGTQALSAGVVSGVLFFIACIVIAVCAVNMCNKRRKKRAEKAAYVMMACPVLESHTDIAALNSNSLMKNGHANPSQGRVPGVTTNQNSNSLYQLAQNLMDKLTGNKPVVEPRDTTDGPSQQPTFICRDIRYSSNAAVPVDVAEASRSLESATNSEEFVTIDHANNTKTTSTPIDDYWIRKPSDRKWGTLTVAASRLAERRAREASSKQHKSQVADADSLADEYYSAAENTFANLPASSQTLPRFFGQSLPRKEAINSQQFNLRQNETTNWQLTQMSERSHQQFNDWLRSQLSGATRPANQAQVEQHADLSVPPKPPLRAYQREISRTANQQPAYQLTQPLNMQQNAVHPMVYHQRSISQIEPPALNSYWIQQQMAATNQQLCASQSYTTAAPVMLYNQSFAPSESFGPAQVPATVLDVRNLGKRNSLQRSTLPLTASAHLWPQIQQTGPTNASQTLQFPGQDDDDPVTANACLGSNKRKSRRPNIMEKFTITPPALPPKVQTERDAVANGHLFVRSLATHPQQPPPPPPPPPPGQRREHQRLRPSNFEPLSRVESIGVNEKIESYLRHQAQEARAAPSSESDSSPPDSSSPVELDRVRELTFQPYHNLPQLKYTISLPLQKTNDGTLLLAETSHLRRSRREKARRRSVGTATGLDDSGSTGKNAVQEANKSAVSAIKRRLGSSSSCPAPPAEFDDSDLHLSAGNLSLEDTADSRRHMHLPAHLRPIAADSLEEGVSQKPKSPPPFYLHSPRLSESPPPVPLHRSKQQVNNNNNVAATHALPIDTDQLEQRTGASKEVQRQSSSDSSQSPHSSSSPSSSSSSSSSSTSAATTTENGGATSEALTNDHSVDEQYEFDMVPSARSRRRSGAHLMMNGVVYTRVVRQEVSQLNAKPANETGDETSNVARPMERSRLYCDVRCKRVPLPPPPTPQRDSSISGRDADQLGEQQTPAAIATANPNDLYDTVYDTTN